ncbi:shikimate dehydrogenase [Jannaschia pagri]|uniref:Shikimate dehydrogenase n=1 Tax=Jannaschia pagri TaxID=2829797 RepID=A0ABQ4NP40_9RHOB|nr:MULTISPECIES: shikimate dehydrogenase [unclassified Jannaschia]GIT92336.1 shikimate dehydrogenase [Jannaschia sp. AI_61]GIT96171.1 shikimate dehydrogenase [Jannaschia sp. AI_62]
MKNLRCGLIGENIGRSRLAAALRIMADDAGIGFEFTAIDTANDPDVDFDALVDHLRLQGWTGVTVTHPWKTHAAAWAGDNMGAVGHLGAANTLTFAPVAGDNTDYRGFLAAWRAQMDRAPGHVAVAGAGGVARAVVPALQELGADQITLWDPRTEAAKALADQAGVSICSLADAGAVCGGADGLVNCTPLGMAPDARSAFDAAWFGPQAWAFDAVYTPTDTPFLRLAEAAGLTTMTGFDLFRHMAMASFETYTGHRPDPAATLPKLDALRPE